MVKKLAGLTSFFTTTSIKQVSDTSTSGGAASMSSWQWPSCKQPRTLSFRQQQQQQAYKTMNSAFYLPVDSAAGSTNSFASVDDDDSLSTAASEDTNDEAEAVIRALRSDRLFFEPCTSPAATSSSLLSKASSKVQANAMKDFQGATAMTMESSNPYRDFRASMEEMVVMMMKSTSHQGGGGGVKEDWRWLEEMLGWYLRANGKSTHGLIVDAFVDLLVALTDDTTASPSNCSSSCSACAPPTDRAHGLMIDQEEGNTE